MDSLLVVDQWSTGKDQLGIERITMYAADLPLAIIYTLKVDR